MAWNQGAPLAARLSAQQEHEQQVLTPIDNARDWWRRQQQRGQEELRKGLLKGLGEAKIAFFRGADVTTIADLAAIDVDHMANHYDIMYSKNFFVKWKNVAREYQEQRLLRAAMQRIEI